MFRGKRPGVLVRSGHLWRVPVLVHKLLSPDFGCCCQLGLSTLVAPEQLSTGGDENTGHTLAELGTDFSALLSTSSTLWPPATPLLGGRPRVRLLHSQHVACDLYYTASHGPVKQSNHELHESRIHSTHPGRNRFSQRQRGCRLTRTGKSGYPQ